MLLHFSTILTMYKHIFFDLDRTLWDFETNSKDTLRELFYKYNLNDRIDNFDQWYAAYKQHNKRLWEQYGLGEIKKETLRETRFYLTFKDFGIDDMELGLLFDKEYIEQSPKKKILFPNAVETLEYLKAKYSLHIITNGFSEIQHIKLKSSGISSFFANVFTSEMVGYHKPHPAIFRHAMSCTNAKKTECLMVGDDYEADIVGAKNAGIDQIFFTPNKAASVAIAPTYTIQSLEELTKIL